MKRRDFLHSSLLAAATSAVGLRAAYAVVASDKAMADVAAFAQRDCVPNMMANVKPA